MAENILYEFDGFQLDPVKQQFFRDGILVHLPPTPFDLLLVFVQNPGRDFTRDELIERVWKGAFVDPKTFDVHLSTVRKVLGEPKRAPRYLIKTSDGYRLVLEVRKVIGAKESSAESERASSLTAETSTRKETKSEQFTFVMGKPVTHTLISCSMYSALYAVAVPLEVAYQFRQFGPAALKIVPLVFGGILVSSIVTLSLDRKLIFKDKTSGLVVSILLFIVCAAALLGALYFFLPSSPVTESKLQTYPAQAAYLKDESYFVILAIFFLLIPFHFVTTMEREMANGNHRAVLGLLTGDKLIAPPKSAIYPRLWVLAGLLLVFFIMSVAMTARLLDNLRPNPYQNLFVQLVYLRGLLFFGLGIECLAWYRNALNEIKVSIRARLQ